MKNFLYILLLFPFFASSQTYNLSSDPLLHILPPVVTPVDTTIFFVNNSGDDSRPGYPEDSSWQTISKVEGETFDPGDQILFNKGDTWRLINDPGSTWSIDWVGTAGNTITLGTYGSGDRPRFLGSDTITNWTDNAGNVWWGYKASLDTFPDGRLFFEETDGSVTWGILETEGLAELDTNYEYVYTQDTIYIRYTSDPATAFTSVEVPQEDDLIQLESNTSSSEYVIFDGIEVAYGRDGSGIRNEYPGADGLAGVEVRNCEIHHIGYKNDPNSFGTNLSYDDMTIEDNIIHNLGRRNITVSVYDAYGLRNIIIQNNILYDGWHTCGMDIFGLAAGGSIDVMYIRGNFIWQDTASTFVTQHIYVDDQTGSPGGGTCPIDSVFIYNNIFLNTSQRAIYIDEVSNAFVYHNTVYGFNPDNHEQQFAATPRSVDTRLINNLVYGDATSGAYREIMRWDTTSGFDSINNNLYYQTDFTVRALTITNATPVGYRFDTEWTDYLTDYPTYDANSPIPSNPLVNTGSYADTDGPTSPEWMVYEGSSAIDSAMALASVTTDFYGVARGSPPDIGAIEGFIDFDTCSSFSMNYTAVQDSFDVVTSGCDATLDTFRLQVQESSYPTSRTDGTNAYAGSTAPSGRYEYNSPDDGTVIYGRLYGGVSVVDAWNPDVNQDTTLVDSVGGYYAAYQTIYDTLVVWGVTPASATATAQSNMVESLDTAGIWSQLDGMYVMACTDSTAALLEWSSLLAARKLVLNGSLTFTQDQGITGTASDDEYGETNWDIGDAVNFAQDDGFIGVYARTNPSGNKMLMGNANTFMGPRYSGSKYWRVNAGANEIDAQITTPQFFAIDRSGANDEDFYSNGSKTDDGTNASQAPNANSFAIWAYHQAGSTWLGESDAQIAIVIWGGSLGETDQGDLNTILETYMDALGTGIQ